MRNVGDLDKLASYLGLIDSPKSDSTASRQPGHLFEPAHTPLIVPIGYASEGIPHLSLNHRALSRKTLNGCGNALIGQLSLGSAHQAVEESGRAIFSAYSPAGDLVDLHGFCAELFSLLRSDAESVRSQGEIADLHIILYDDTGDSSCAVYNLEGRVGSAERGGELGTELLMCITDSTSSRGQPEIGRSAADVLRSGPEEELAAHLSTRTLKGRGGVPICIVAK